MYQYELSKKNQQKTACIESPHCTIAPRRRRTSGQFKKKEKPRDRQETRVTVSQDRLEKLGAVEMPFEPTWRLS